MTRTDYRVRLLGPGDLPACMALKDEAAWNQTEQDWLALFAAAPDGCFGIDLEGELAGTTTIVCYDGELAWLGMVLTSARFRRLGIATALLDHALQHAARKRVQWVKLDATDMARPLYKRFGFENECAVERWLRPGKPPAPFTEQSQRAGDSIARGRPGSQAAYFGPCHASSPSEAQRLLEWFIDLHPDEAIFWDLLPRNTAAVDLASSHGFQPSRKLVRMERCLQPGAPPRPTDPRTYAIAGFEWG